MFVTEETFQPLRGWLNEWAALSIQLISVTEETFQPLRGWLKESAL